MDYCGPRAIPHSRFLSWSQVDQDKALAWLLDEQAKCAGCGSRPEEWLAADGVNEAHPPPFEVESFLCWGCRHTAEFEEHLSEEGARAGHHVYLKRTDFSEFDPETVPWTSRLVPLSET